MMYNVYIIYIYIYPQNDCQGAYVDKSETDAMRGVLLGARLRGTADHDGQADQLTAGSGLTFAEIMADIRS